MTSGNHADESKWQSPNKSHFQADNMRAINEGVFFVFVYTLGHESVCACACAHPNTRRPPSTRTSDVSDSNETEADC